MEIDAAQKSPKIKEMRRDSDCPGTGTINPINCTFRMALHVWGSRT